MRTDCVLVSDTMWVSLRRPTCPSALRGFQGFSFVLQTGREERHSGDVGGAARNPLGELMALICQIYDPITGRVKIPGFCDDVVPPTRREIREFRRSGFSVAAFQRDDHLLSLRVQDPLAVMARIWAEPAFEVHGVTGRYTGRGIKSIVPARAEIKASCRLVPNQRPEAIARGS